MKRFYDWVKLRESDFQQEKIKERQYEPGINFDWANQQLQSCLKRIKEYMTRIDLNTQKELNLEKILKSTDIKDAAIIAKQLMQSPFWSCPPNHSPCYKYAGYETREIKNILLEILNLMGNSIGKSTSNQNKNQVNLDQDLFDKVKSGQTVRINDHKEIMKLKLYPTQNGINLSDTDELKGMSFSVTYMYGTWVIKRI